MEKAPGLNIAEAKSEDDLDWLSRSVHWGNFHAETRPATTRLRSAIRLPLILTGHGVRLRVDHGALVVRDGFTHYPQTVEDRHLFPGAVDLPSRIIVVDGSGGLTFDVLDWLATQSIPLVRIDWKGSVRAVVVGSGFSANPSQVLWQRETRADPVRRVEFTRRLIRRKLVSSLQTLEAAFRGFRKLEEAQSRIQAQIDRLESDPPRDIPTLMGIEANAAATYFRFWKDITLKWKRVPGRVIPDNWRQFTARRSILLDSSNRKAADPINAMLNYAYAVLQSHMQIQLVADGYDPTFAILHQDMPGETAFVYDVMEPFRPVVDQALLAFIWKNTFHPGDFVLRSDGACRLNPQLAREVTKLTLEAIKADPVAFSSA